MIVLHPKATRHWPLPLTSDAYLCIGIDRREADRFAAKYIPDHLRDEFIVLLRRVALQYRITDSAIRRRRAGLAEPRDFEQMVRALKRLRRDLGDPGIVNRIEAARGNEDRMSTAKLPASATWEATLSMSAMDYAREQIDWLLPLVQGAAAFRAPVGSRQSTGHIRVAAEPFWRFWTEKLKRPETLYYWNDESSEGLEFLISGLGLIGCAATPEQIIHLDLNSRD